LTRSFVDGAIREVQVLKNISHCFQGLGFHTGAAVVHSGLLILLCLVAHIESIGISHHLKTDRQLHVLYVTQEKLVQVASCINCNAHLYLKLGPWLDNSRAWLKLDDTAVRILLLVPSKMSWQITEIGENHAHLLMLGLRIDVLLDTGIDPAEVHASSV